MSEEFPHSWVWRLPSGFGTLDCVPSDQETSAQPAPQINLIHPRLYHQTQKVAGALAGDSFFRLTSFPYGQVNLLSSHFLIDSVCYLSRFPMMFLCHPPLRTRKPSSKIWRFCHSLLDLPCTGTPSQRNLDASSQSRLAVCDDSSFLSFWSEIGPCESTLDALSGCSSENPHWVLRLCQKPVVGKSLDRE